MEVSEPLKVKKISSSTDPKRNDPLPDYRFRVTSGHQAMGKLIIQWSKDAGSQPKNLQQLEALCKDLGIGLEIGADITELLLVRMPFDHRAVVYIPPVSMLEEQLPPSEYPLPDFYAKAYPCQQDIQDKESFRHSRIGEYTTQKCM